MITIEDDGIHCLLMIGGEGSLPTLELSEYFDDFVELPDAEYIQLLTGTICTNEQNMYNLFTGKYASQPAPPLLNVDSREYLVNLQNIEKWQSCNVNIKKALLDSPNYQHTKQGEGL